MKRLAYLLGAATLMGACDPGPAAPEGTYSMSLSGIQTTRLDASDPGLESEYALESTAAVYVDIGAYGGDLSYLFNAMEFQTPKRGRLFEMRLFPNAFENDYGTTTLAGVFDEQLVEAFGQAYVAAGYQADVTLIGHTEPTSCAYYERYRANFLSGTWSEDGTWDVVFDAYYEDHCFDDYGELKGQGIPSVQYTLEGQMELLYELDPEAPESAGRYTR